MFRPAFPNEPYGGMTNAAVVNHRFGPGLDNVGSPTRLGRSFAPKPSDDRPVLLLSKSGSRATVNGRPVCNVRTPVTSQFASRSEAQPCVANRLLPVPNGMSQVNPNERPSRES